MDGVMKVFTALHIPQIGASGDNIWVNIQIFIIIVFQKLPPDEKNMWEAVSNALSPQNDFANYNKIAKVNRETRQLIC